MIRFITFILLLLSACTNVHGQFRLPAFDVSIKGGFFANISEMGTRLSDDSEILYQYEAFVYSGEVNFHISQHVAAGAFWTKSFAGKVKSEMENPYYALGEADAAHQMYGLALRFSTGRRTGFRPYIQGTFFKQEMYFDYETLRVANSSGGFGVGIGAMIKLSDKLYLNIPDVSFKLFSDGFFFDDYGQQVYLEFRGGLTYNFTKRK